MNIRKEKYFVWDRSWDYNCKNRFNRKCRSEALYMQGSESADFSLIK